MKKLVYTLSFVALVGLTSKAQEPVKQEQPAPVKKEAKNNQRPVSETPAPEAKQPGEQPKSRMAITQKGVPASKSKESKETKQADPKGHPATTEKH